jgi:hypothetical protein
MSQNNTTEPNNHNFEKFVLNHSVKNSDSEQNLNNVNFEFADENDIQFVKNNNVNSKMKHNSNEN